MGNNYNTWGGKNNSWGNKNRKGGSGNSSNRGGGGQEPTPLFNTIAGGIVIFLLAGAGLSAVTEGISMATDSLDFVNKLKSKTEVASEARTEKSKEVDRETEVKHKASVGSTQKVTLDDVISDLESEDVADMLDTLNELLADDSNVSIEDKIVYLGIESISSSDNFLTDVILRSNKIDDNVTFIIKSDAECNREDAVLMNDYISMFLKENQHAIDWDVHSYANNGVSGYGRPDGTNEYLFIINFFN